MERIRIEDFVTEVVRQIDEIPEEHKQRVIERLLKFASLEDIKTCIREVSRG